jgi:tRNA(fMet)-specific endonuclease VapC
LILSLDTNVMVDLVNGRRPQVRRRYDEAVARGDLIVTCAVAAYELMYGALISQRPEAQCAAAERLLKNVEIADWSFADGLAAAQIRRGLRRRGASIGEHDLLIAGQAVNRGWSVVSGNLREFLRIDTLEVLDWTTV